jgi:hypothetical protein
MSFHFVVSGTSVNVVPLLQNVHLESKFFVSFETLDRFETNLTSRSNFSSY